MAWRDKEPTRELQPMGRELTFGKTLAERSQPAIEQRTAKIREAVGIAPRAWEEEAPMASEEDRERDMRRFNEAQEEQHHAVQQAYREEPEPVDELSQAAAARDLLNRLAAEGKIGLTFEKPEGPATSNRVVVIRPVTRTVVDWEEL